MQETKEVYFTSKLATGDVDTEFRRVLHSVQVRSPIFPAPVLAGWVMTSADVADIRRVSWDQVK